VAGGEGRGNLPLGPRRSRRGRRAVGGPGPGGTRGRVLPALAVGAVCRIGHTVASRSWALIGFVKLCQYHTEAKAAKSNGPARSPGFRPFHCDPSGCSRPALECGDLSPLFLIARRQEALRRAGRFLNSGVKPPHSKVRLRLRRAGSFASMRLCVKHRLNCHGQPAPAEGGTTNCSGR
jgi:hypothetical protein